jgi:hypothetical protein
MNKLEIYRILLEELKVISAWCKQPSSVEKFDIDDVYKVILERYNISMSFGFLNPIYALVDTMCDSIRHGQKNITNSYTVENGIHDLEAIIKLIETGDISSLEDDINLKKKLEGLYGQ